MIKMISPQSRSHERTAQENIGGQIEPRAMWVRGKTGKSTNLASIIIMITRQDYKNI